MKNMGAILEAAGSDWSKVVKTTILLVDMADFATVNTVYGKYFPEQPPARATFAVQGLPLGRWQMHGLGPGRAAALPPCNPASVSVPYTMLHIACGCWWTRPLTSHRCAHQSPASCTAGAPSGTSVLCCSQPGVHSPVGLPIAGAKVEIEATALL